ncbi:SGNH/GDSL hydrolase family protein [Nocardioides sp. CER19]|uniref:SGNH/GDSL hydrolase family protein n=1 Tax=Nocardioides sp. CER19 TaxID=3038538 RepID=UPI0024471D06|nr:SGNH/GDSL hydrolase family protein [Nocardioides sp. CER19]MDH2415161.1 SGNH/GDSL hydrolase family protein [Nocardioides sp. CER19]
MTEVQHPESAVPDPLAEMTGRPTGPTYRRFVAIGDSWTEGLGDPDPERPNGLRGWADRVAEVLATRCDDFGYANLAIRGRRVGEILEEQLAPALALAPDLISIQAGGNDFLRAGIDIDALVEAIDGAVAASVGAGAEVVLFTHGAAAAGPFRALRGRIAIFNELLREVVDARGVVLVDNWRVREARDPRYWDADRVHLSPLGHHRAAMHVLDALGIEHRLEPPLLPDATPLTGRDRVLAELDWVRRFAAPWVRRRLTGRSLGDDIAPKRPTLSAI